MTTLHFVFNMNIKLSDSVELLDFFLTSQLTVNVSDVLSGSQGLDSFTCQAMLCSSQSQAREGPREKLCSPPPSVYLLLTPTPDGQQPLSSAFLLY